MVKVPINEGLLSVVRVEGVDVSESHTDAPLQGAQSSASDDVPPPVPPIELIPTEDAHHSNADIAPDVPVETPPTALTNAVPLEPLEQAPISSPPYPELDVPALVVTSADNTIHSVNDDAQHPAAPHEDDSGDNNENDFGYRDDNEADDDDDDDEDIPPPPPPPLLFVNCKCNGYFVTDVNHNRTDFVAQQLLGADLGTPASPSLMRQSPLMLLTGLMMST